MEDTYSTPKERVKETHYLVKSLGTGNTAGVYIYIPKSVAEPAMAQYGEGDIEVDERFARLRGAVGCIKIQEHASPEHFNLDSEIDALQHINRLGDARLSKMFEYHDAPRWADWYKLEGFSGGSLEKYALQLDTAPPAALGWHMVHELCGALLNLHFGAVLDDSWPMFFHGDLTWDNVLFRPTYSTSTSYMDYPSLVVVDFGEARSLKSMNLDAEAKGFFAKQYEDLRTSMDAVSRVFGHVPALLNLGARLDKHEKKHAAFENSNAALKKLLVAWEAEAARERDAAYVALSPADAQYFGLELITDKEIQAGLDAQQEQEMMDALPIG